MKNAAGVLGVFVVVVGSAVWIYGLCVSDAHIRTHGLALVACGMAIVANVRLDRAGIR